MAGQMTSTRPELPTPKVVVKVVDVSDSEIHVVLSGALEGQVMFPITTLFQGGRKYLIIQIDPKHELAGRKENRDPMISALMSRFPECVVQSRSLTKIATRPQTRNVVSHDEDDETPASKPTGSGGTGTKRKGH